MARARKGDKSKPKRGRPVTTGGLPLLATRVPAEIIAAIDGIARSKEMTRSDVVRELFEQALAHTPHRARPKAESVKANALARRELERATKDDGAHPEEQERRKRRLLKGPKEFRDMRGDGGRRIKDK